MELMYEGELIEIDYEEYQEYRIDKATGKGFDD